jgi:hypothetical protein
VLTVASGYLAGTSATAVNRLLVTVAGAGIGLVATVVIPVPKHQELPAGGAPAEAAPD